MYSKSVNTINIQYTYCPQEGLSISQPEERTKNKVFICPNASCGKTFTRPVKASNVRESNASYDACPYCLTEIINTQIPAVAEDLPKEEEVSEASVAVTEVTESKSSDTKSSDTKLPGCKNHLGYLGERSTKDIPDECLVCSAIVQCMRKGKE